MTRILHLVIRRWLVTLAIAGGLLSAPLAMANERVRPAPQAPAMSHCADMGEPAPAEHAPVKQFRCMGACLGVAPEVIGLSLRVKPSLPRLDIPPAVSLVGVVTAHDPPPPRTA